MVKGLSPLQQSLSPHCNNFQTESLLTKSRFGFYLLGQNSKNKIACLILLFVLHFRLLFKCDYWLFWLLVLQFINLPSFAQSQMTSATWSQEIQSPKTVQHSWVSQPFYHEFGILQSLQHAPWVSHSSASAQFQTSLIHRGCDFSHLFPWNNVQF